MCIYHLVYFVEYMHLFVSLSSQIFICYLRVSSFLLLATSCCLLFVWMIVNFSANWNLLISCTKGQLHISGFIDSYSLLLAFVA